MEEKVLTIIGRIMRVPVEGLSSESSMHTVDGWDSIRHMGLMLALEEEFGVMFSDEELVTMLSVKAILTALNEKLK